MLARGRVYSILKNDVTALEAHEAVVQGMTRIGGSDEYSALQRIARIQQRRGRLDEALRTLNRADRDKLQGVGRTNILKSIEGVEKARSVP